MSGDDREGDGRTEREAYYEELLDEQEESGLSVAGFAEERGLSAATLYSWRRRLGRASVHKRGAALIEVCVAEGEGSHGSATRMIVKTADGTSIELDVDFDETALERLLGVLDRC
jgi:hypothetical protein